jgi:hypothetical protein
MTTVHEHTDADPAVEPTFTLFLTVLPGPDRKRSGSLYHYRVTYRNPDPQAPGCVTHWEVVGGRMPYQIALERDEYGRHYWHCTCADAVYRAEEQGRVCKHVEGLFTFGQPLPRPAFVRRSA